jgi:phosphoglucosamine mutase
MANGGLARALEPLGGKIIHTQVGDRYVVEAMREHGLAIGGESSGHMIILDHNTTGDAIIAALQVLAIIVRKEQPLTDLAHAYQEMPESHQKVPLGGKPKPSQESLDALVDEIRDELAGKGRVVIRPSGTEPIVRVMVQHQDARTAQTLTKQLADRVAAL